MTKQFTLLKSHKLTFGGAALKGHPRSARPLCTKRAIHLVLKSSRAHGSRSFLNPRHKTKIERIIQRQAQGCGVTIYDYANGGNHLHFALKISNLRLFRKFLRVVTGLIARTVLQAQKASAKLQPNQTFWDARPFTRVVSWGRAYEHLKSYLVLNKLEALGFVKYQSRANKNRKLYSIKVEPIEVGWRRAESCAALR